MLKEGETDKIFSVKSNYGTATINYKYPKSRNKEVKQTMLNHFTLEYWIDDNWYVGRRKEVPGVFSQGESLEELEKQESTLRVQINC
ncbi:hypothetical protein ES705_31867 [subsurface metagenome]